jgi:hypothetical protein
VFIRLEIQSFSKFLRNAFFVFTLLLIIRFVIRYQSFKFLILLSETLVSLVTLVQYLSLGECIPRNSMVYDMMMEPS